MTDAPATDDLRRRRDEVRAQEQRVSFHRRVLQAQLDMLAAVAAGSDEDLSASLPHVLADAPPTSTVAARSVDVAVPDGDVDVDPLPADVATLPAEERERLAERLRAEERSLSDERRALLDELDGLQTALVARYREDGVDARALLGGGDA